MRFIIVILVVGIWGSFWCGPAMAADEAERVVFVQSQNAALMAQPAFGGEPLERLARGMEVEVLEAGDSWHRIRVGELEGWMPALILRDTPPNRRESHLDRAAEMDASARRRASAVTTAGAIRGVEEDERLLDDPNLDVEALRRLEALAVSGDEALEFLLEEEAEETQ
ncbi:hypothetical protein [Natronospira bacteriovora]|uniref:SH3 domain-containing protein n=1 Tax=Natronospira bacteriovora TaxID=3069753 RepID=A0ABU0W7R7_9GAMM|nr:hypothetical protein [Natronospira sp. AB-CW4]MDQ2070054.1 hypothetical protein [Natronospira sp. AB-CW4]